MGGLLLSPEQLIYAYTVSEYCIQSYFRSGIRHGLCSLLGNYNVKFLVEDTVFIIIIQYSFI